MVDSVNTSTLTPVLPGDITGQIRPQDLEQAAGQFEAMFLKSMLQEMRKASDVLGEGNIFDSKQQHMMRDFYDDKLASQLASQRATGIARMIVTQLGPALTHSATQVKEPANVDALSENKAQDSLKIKESR